MANRFKKEYLVLLVVIIALSLYLTFRNRDRTHYRLPSLAALDQKKISKIEMTHAGDTIILKKQDDRWHIMPQGYPANDDAVNNMLDAIEDMVLTALVSSSKSYERYDLDADKKISVKVWAGDKLAREFDVGKAAPSFRHTFVKIAHDAKVYHARGNFRSRFDQTVEKLRDKTVLSFNRDDIHEVRITKGKTTLLLAKKEAPAEVKPDQEADSEKASSTKTELAGWQTPEGKEADETKLKTWLGTLSHLRCDMYLDDLKKDNLKDPIYSVQLKGIEPYTLSIFDKKDKTAREYPAVSSANDYPFLLRQWQVDNIMKSPDDLVKKERGEGSKKGGATNPPQESGPKDPSEQ
ncbi:MAG: DUF4340 domain-containing protein [Deltaproteobacteria bacterium]|nr:DUF4340 domain-containing protein [Deltaproteobacteria bacterium]